MEGHQQKFSTSNHHPLIAAASPKPSLTDSRESNENDSGKEQTVPMLHSTKKTGADYLVSPAVSAAFEAAAPRRKILVERSENSISFEGHSNKTSDFVPKRSPGVLTPSEHLSPVILLYNSDHDGEVDGNTVAHSYLKAYSYTNYMSPMPDLVRVDRNRCEILNFQAKEVAEVPGSCNVDKDKELEPKDLKDTFRSPGKESIEKQEIEEKSENGVEMIEEEEEFEERGWCLGGVLEFMLILIAYSLSTSYICSMNSPAPATNSQVIWSPKNDYLINQSCTVETSTMKMYDTGFMAVGVEDCYANEVETDEGGILLIKRHAKGEMIQNNAVIFEDREVDNVTDEEAETKDESLDKNESEFEKFAQSTGAKAVENEDDYDCGMEKHVVDESDEDNLEESDGALETEVESKIKILEQVSGPGTHKNEDSGGYESETKEYAFTQSGEFEISAKSDVKEFEDEKAGHFAHEVDEIGYDEVETEITGWNTLTIIIVSLASTVLGSIAFTFGSDKARTTSTENSQSSRDPNECAVEESATTVFPAVEERIKSRAGPSLPLSMDEAFKELSFQMHAPKVKLIGELVVGEVNGSFRGYSRKKQMTHSAENMNRLIQPAISSNRPSVPQISTIHSTSHASYDGENKITNEGMKNAGEAKLIVTPVRRSNRIRNQALAMSP